MSKNIHVTQNQYGAWLIYAGEDLIFSSLIKARALQYIEAIR